jgi:predicted small metal-binding protein
MECNLCGETLSAANDDELVRTARRHMDEHHPESALDEARVRELVGEQAYDAMDS